MSFNNYIFIWKRNFIKNNYHFILAAWTNFHLNHLSFARRVGIEPTRRGFGDLTAALAVRRIIN